MRAHTIPLAKRASEIFSPNGEPKRRPDRALVLDCESQITADQTLTFGFWRFCELRDGEYVPREEGIFHDEGLSTKKLDVLRKYARATKPETASDGRDRLRLYSRSKFIAETTHMYHESEIRTTVIWEALFHLDRFSVRTID